MCLCACVWGILNECILGQVGMNQPFGYKLAQTGYKLTEFGYEMTGYKTTMSTKQLWIWNNHRYKMTMGMKWPWVQITSIHHLCFQTAPYTFPIVYWQEKFACKSWASLVCWIIFFILMTLMFDWAVML